MIGPRPPPVCLLCKTHRMVLRRQRRLIEGIIWRLTSSAAEVRPDHPLVSFPEHGVSLLSKTRDHLNRVQDYIRDAKPNIALVRQSEALIQRPVPPPPPEQPLEIPDLAILPLGPTKAEPATRFPPGYRGPVSHEAFRAIVLTTKCDMTIRLALRVQFLQCQTPRDVLRIVATGMQRPDAISEHLGRMAEPLMRALYRSRRTSSDRLVLSTLTSIVLRFRHAGIHVDQQLYQLGLKFAARTRSLAHMKKFLRYFRECGFHMTGHVFRSVIAKCSIGHRGLGEIRNGRWRRSELLQVLTGFDDCRHLPEEEQFHLGTFLDREQWQYWHGWVAALSHCRGHELVAREWELWKACGARRYPMQLNRQSVHMTTRARGDYWFVEQMCYAGNIEKAWSMLRETELKFENLKRRVKGILVERVDYAGEMWSEDVRRALLDKYDYELGAIEQALGIAWVPIDLDDEAQGFHVMIENQESVLDRIGAPDWKFREDFGFPWDSLPDSPCSAERSLHEAVPTTLVERSAKMV